MEHLLLLHGALGSAAHFDALCQTLEGQFLPLTLDFPGHGDAPFEGAFSIDLFAQKAFHYLDVQGIYQPVAVFGYSMGGYVALQMALLAPEHIRCVVTLGTKFDWTPETASREVGRLQPDRMLERAPDFAAALAQRHHTQNWRQVVGQTADLLHRLRHGEAFTADDLCRITCPAIVGLGSHDRMVTREEAEWAARQMPRGRLDILPDWPHPIEQVPVGALSNWLRQVLLS